MQDDEVQELKKPITVRAIVEEAKSKPLIEKCILHLDLPFSEAGRIGILGMYRGVEFDVTFTPVGVRDE